MESTQIARKCAFLNTCHLHTLHYVTKLCPMTRLEVMSLPEDCILQASNHNTQTVELRWNMRAFKVNAHNMQSIGSDITSNLDIGQIILS